MKLLNLKSICTRLAHASAEDMPQGVYHKVLWQAKQCPHAEFVAVALASSLAFTLDVRQRLRLANFDLPAPVSSDLLSHLV